jgi:multidrug efflux pump subunit AcrA (membrane-fusion protein)
MSQSYHCLTVPLKAMVDAARNKVFVIDENGILHLKEVTVGSDDGKNVEIYSGLSAGDIVVVDSMEGLAEGMKAEIILEGENG